MSVWLRRGVKAFLVLVLAALALLGLTLGFLHSPFFRYPTGDEFPPARIHRLIWPTIGCPALVTPGGVLEAELDLDGLEGAKWLEAEDFRASMRPARAELAGISRELEPLEARRGPSRRWPYRGAEGEGEEVWTVSFRVPGDAFPELYDLRVEVEAEGDGAAMSEEQPHALGIMEDGDDRFTFVTLSDIHVHERGNSSLFSRQTDRGLSDTGEPLFLYQAIEQLNLIRPDFVLMLGDFIRGQRRPGELLKEYERFYQALLELEVPAFLLPGNHDQYVNGIDGARWFEANLGPLYYSFDVGGCHFTCLDSYQWPEGDRVVMNKLFFMEPRRWQGQVLDAPAGEGYSAPGAQLSWLEKDLFDHAGSALRVVAMHHDPCTPEGRGYSYINVNYWGIYHAGGGGRGREELLELMALHRVHHVFGGHLHMDAVSSLPWEGGGGETVYSCQTCVYFGGGGWSEHYPGYRLVEVEDGGIVSFSYLDGTSSYPLYDGSHPGAVVDLDLLETPAVWAEEEDPGEGAVAGFAAGNFLAVPVRLRGLVLDTEASPSGRYEVEGADLIRAVALPGDGSRALLYLEVMVEAGVPGEAGDRPGVPSMKRGRVLPVQGR